MYNKYKLSKGFFIFSGVLITAILFVLLSKINIPSQLMLAQVSGASDITSGLVGYWNMDSSDIDWSANTILDRSGNGNQGSLVGLSSGSDSVNGKYGQAMTFNGVNKISIPSAQSLNLSINNAFTYSVWLKNASQIDTWRAVIYSDVLHNLSVGNSLILIRPGGSVRQLVQYGPNNNYPSYVVGEWYHLAVTYDGSNIYIYVNGQSSCSSCNVAATGTMSTVSSLSIGSTFKGDIDEVRVYNRALSQSEITALYGTQSFNSTALTPPLIPQGLVSNTQTSSSISLSWNANTESDISSYKIYRNGALLAVLDKNTLSYLDDGLSANTSYTYAINAINNSNLEGPKTSDLAISTKPNDTPVISGTVTPAQYLAARTPPVFKPNHTLLPLTKWSWPYGFDMKVEMANWGYALDLGDADAESVARLSDPNSEISKLIALAQQNPSKYKLFVGIPRVPVSMIPASVYVPDSSGNPTSVFSPEAPTDALNIMATYIKDNLKKITDKAPLSIIHNGGERYMGVCGFDCASWKLDPRVIAARGNRSWADYISNKKADQELVFTNAVRSISNAPYIWYFAGGNQSRAKSCSFWDMWDWDYRYMKEITDYPNSSMYYQEGNTGWTGHLMWTGCVGTSNNDILSQALNAYGYAATFGKPLSYNWVNSGYGRYGFADHERYTGFLKSYYVAGMIGGIAGYFDYPTGGFNAAFDANNPPHWVRQVEILGQVHAEFSYLEDILRGGDLLPGPDINEKNPSQPAYEFRTGYNDTRVLARKMKGQKRWLISAWAADNVSRKVSVAIPVIGTVSLDAKPAGSLYDARIVSGSLVLTQIDNGSMNPTPLSLPSSQPDSDNSVPYVPPPVATTYTLSLTKSGTGTGTVTGGSISCGTTCSQTSNSGTSITLVATPSTGSSFTGWGGSCSGTGSCIVNLNSNITVTATFNQTVVLDTTPPVISVAGLSSNLPSGTNSIVLTITTDESATCKWGKVANTTYTSLPNTFTKSTNTHTSTITNLVTGVNTVYVRCQDTSGNINTTDTPVTITVSAPPPVVNNPPVVIPVVVPPSSPTVSVPAQQTTITISPIVAPTIVQPKPIIKQSTVVKPVVKPKPPTTAPTPAVVYTDLVLDGGPFEAYKTPTFWELFIQYLKDVWNTAFQFASGSVLRVYNGFIEVF